MADKTNKEAGAGCKASLEATSHQDDSPTPSTKTEQMGWQTILHTMLHMRPGALQHVSGQMQVGGMSRRLDSYQGSQEATSCLQWQQSTPTQEGHLSDRDGKWQGTRETRQRQGQSQQQWWSTGRCHTSSTLVCQQWCCSKHRASLHCHENSVANLELPRIRGMVRPKHDR